MGFQPLSSLLLLTFLTLESFQLLPLVAEPSTKVSIHLLHAKYRILIYSCIEIYLFLQLYIVYMGERKHEDPNHVTASQHDLLTSILGRYLIYYYI